MIFDILKNRQLTELVGWKTILSVKTIMFVVNIQASVLQHYDDFYGIVNCHMIFF